MITLITRLNTDLEPSAVLRIVCEEALHALGALAGAAARYPQHLSQSLLVVGCGLDPQPARALIPLPEVIRAAGPHPTIAPAAIGAPAGSSASSLARIGLWRDQHLVGVLVIVLPEPCDHFSPATTTLLASIANLAAQALIGASRLDREHTRAEQLVALNALGQTLAETLDLDQIFSLLYQAICRLVPDVDVAIFSLFDAPTREIRCAFAIHDGERVDPAELPPLPLAPPGQGFQSDVIHTRRPVIAGSYEEMIERATLLIEVGTPGEVVQSILFVPMLAKNRVIGVLQVQSYIVGRYSQAHASLLGLAANVAAVAIENARLVGELQRSNRELRQAYDTTLEGWSRALDLRDHETEGHSQRVTALTVRLARAAGLDDEQLVAVRWGALLHDIGKMGIPDAILLKPGPLDADEWRQMKLHPVYAHDLLAPIPFLQEALAIPWCHHERWDGTGYPRGLRGTAIPLAARLFAAVDIWDALRSDRPYRPAWPEDRVRAHLRSLAGTHLDPYAVELLLEVLEQAV